MTDARQAKKTALSVGVVLLALGGLSLWRHHPLRAEILGGSGACLILIGLFAPGLAAPFHSGWMKLAGALGYVNSRIILSLVHFLILAPVGLVMRIAGRDPLNRRRPATDSYWIPRPTPRQSREQFERLF